MLCVWFVPHKHYNERSGVIQYVSVPGRPHRVWTWVCFNIKALIDVCNFFYLSWIFLGKEEKAQL